MLVLFLVLFGFHTCEWVGIYRQTFREIFQGFPRIFNLQRLFQWIHQRLRSNGYICRVGNPSKKKAVKMSFKILWKKTTVKMSSKIPRIFFSISEDISNGSIFLGKIRGISEKLLYFREILPLLYNFREFFRQNTSCFLIVYVVYRNKIKTLADIFITIYV